MRPTSRNGIENANWRQSCPVPYHSNVFHRTDALPARDTAAPRLQFVTQARYEPGFADAERVPLTTRGAAQCAQACTRYSYAKAFAAGRTLMTLMRLF